MKYLIAALMLFGCASALSDPRSPESVAAKSAPIIAECRLRKVEECKGYDVEEECPLIQECFSRIDAVDKDCHD